MSIKNNKNQHGFTMIEVLIAAVVLGIGLLGLAALQAQSLQFNFSAYQRSQATILAYDIVDRIRANQSSIASYDQGLGMPGGNVDCQGAAANCDPGTMASFDLQQWKCSLGAFNDNARCIELGGIEGPLTLGDGTIDISAAAGRIQITVTIQWADNRTIKQANGANAATFQAAQMETFSVSTVL